MDCIAGNIHLIHEGKWDEIVNMIKECRLPKLEAACMSCSTKHSLLHYICHYNPPLAIVKEVCITFLKSAFKRDSLNSFPLYVALNNSCSADVVLFLASQNQSAVKSKDKHGRYPIHLAFSNFSRNKSKDEKTIIRNHEMLNLRRIIRCLCKLAPETVITEDDQGMNALEHAIEEEVDMKLINELQAITQIIHRKKLIPITSIEKSITTPSIA